MILCIDLYVWVFGYIIQIKIQEKPYNKQAVLYMYLMKFRTWYRYFFRFGFTTELVNRTYASNAALIKIFRFSLSSQRNIDGLRDIALETCFYFIFIFIFGSESACEFIGRRVCENFRFSAAENSPSSVRAVYGKFESFYRPGVSRRSWKVATRRYGKPRENFERTSGRSGSRFHDFHEFPARSCPGNKMNCIVQLGDTSWIFCIGWGFEIVSARYSGGCLLESLLV